MSSKSASKSATAKSLKQSKPLSKSKPPKSSEYVDDSDLDNDEVMADAPPAKKATPKSTDKISKKRNRDGTEKVNGAGGASSKNGKVVTATPEPKSGSGKEKKKSKKVEVVVEESSEEESKSEASEDESSDKEESDESESESETLEPTKSSKGSTQFKLPLDNDVPAGFTPLDATSSGSIPSSLQGKQIFLFTAPSKFKFSDVKKIKLHSGLEGETITSGDMKFSIRRSVDSVSSSMKVIVPNGGRKGYQLASVAPTAQYLITEAPPSGRTKSREKALAPPPRAQPEGLRMRFMPAGYGEESDYNINEAVLPRRDLVVAGDDDVVMDEVEPVVETPKKPKKGDSKSADTPKEKKKKNVRATEDDVVTENEETPEVVEVEKKKSKKEKKDKSKDGDGKKEKKSKHDEDRKKEKKKHKKDKAEA